MTATIEVPQLILPKSSDLYKVVVFQRMDRPSELPDIYPRFGPTTGLEGTHSWIFQQFAVKLGVDPEFHDLSPDICRLLFPSSFTQYKIRAAGECDLDLEERKAEFRSNSKGYPEFRFVAEDKELLERLLEMSVELEL